jgi:cytochrome c oxidase cbb3-type subunit 3
VTDHAMGEVAPPSDGTRGHHFDGIEEYDNRLPNWWLWTFYLACIFSLGYWLHFHTLGTGALPMAAFDRANEEAAARLTQSEVTADSLTALAAEPAALAAGRKVFLENCMQCHLESGGGNLGPNLTDAYWIHGGSPMDIYRTVVQGVPLKGMPDYWERTLGPQRLQQVVAYLLSIKNSNVAGGKEPQGEPEQ